MNLLRRKNVTFVTKILKDVIYYRGVIKRIENQHGLKQDFRMKRAGDLDIKEDIEMAVTKLTVDNFEQEVLQANKPVLVDFYADWCGPCKMMSPVVDEVAEEEADVKVCQINIDENMDIAQKYRVMSIPTFIAFKNGEEAGRQIGAVPKSALLELVK